MWIKTEVTVFADSDALVEIKEHIRGCDVYIIADVESTSTMLPESIDGMQQSHKIIMERDAYRVMHDTKPLKTIPTKAGVARNFDILCSTIDAARNAVKENGRITVVVPFFPSARQDRRSGRKSLDLKRRAVQIEALGADHVLTIDIHNESTELAFGLRTGFDSLFAAHTFLTHLKENGKDLKNACFVAPDAGAFRRNLMYAEELGVPVSFLYKHRDHTRANVIKGTLGFGGDIKMIQGKDVYIVDDMIDTAGTLVEATKFLKQNGAANITAIATHGVFSPPAFTRLEAAHADGTISSVVVTNSITHAASQEAWLTTIDISKYFAKAIDSLNLGESISNLLREAG